MKKKPGLLKCSRGPVITFFSAKSSFECMQMSTRFSYNELPANALDNSSLLAMPHICQFDKILTHLDWQAWKAWILWLSRLFHKWVWMTLSKVTMDGKKSRITFLVFTNMESPDPVTFAIVSWMTLSKLNMDVKKSSITFLVFTNLDA